MFKTLSTLILGANARTATTGRQAQKRGNRNNSERFNSVFPYQLISPTVGRSMKQICCQLINANQPIHGIIIAPINLKSSSHQFFCA